jgi:hypothetical protein
MVLFGTAVCGAVTTGAGAAGFGAGAGAAATAAAGCGAGAVFVAAGPLASAASMSDLTIRPPGPNFCYFRRPS